MSRVLLDTHVLIWALDEFHRLPTEMREIIQDPHNEVVFSVVSIWEIAIKARLGRTELAGWQASARGRIGYAFDRTLFYVTGGAAFTNVRVGSNFIVAGIFPATVASDILNATRATGIPRFESDST